MAAYDPSALILAGANFDLNQVLAALKSDLPAMGDAKSTDGPTASTSATYATLDSFSLAFEADEAFLVIYLATLACNSVATSYCFGEIRATVDGTQYGHYSRVQTVYENNSADGAQAVAIGFGYGLSGTLTVAGQGRLVWDQPGGDTMYFGNRELICIKWKYRTS